MRLQSTISEVHSGAVTGPFAWTLGACYFVLAAAAVLAWHLRSASLLGFQLAALAIVVGWTVRRFRRAEEQRLDSVQRISAELAALQARTEEVIVERTRATAQACDEVQRGEAWLRRIADANPGCIGYIDAEQRFRFCNRTYRDWYGGTLDSMVGRTVAEVVGASNYPAVAMHYQAALSGRHSSYQRELQRSGTTRHILVELTPDVRDDGGVDGVFISSVDITLQKRGEQALQESEARFRNAFDFAAIGMALVSVSGHWLQVNRALCDLLGYTEQALLKLTFQQLTHQDDLTADLDHVRRLLAGETDSYQMEKRYLHRDGHVVWVLLSVSLVTDQHGAPAHFISQIQDISERKQAEHELAANQQLLIELIDAIPMPLSVKDEARRFVIANEAMGHFHGLGSSHLVGRRDDEIFPAEQAEVYAAEDAAVLADGAPLIADQMYVTLDGKERWVHKQKRRVPRPGGKYWLIVALIDITERKLAELAVERSRKFLDAVIEGIPQPVFVKDLQHRWVLFNQPFCEMMERERDELLGKSDPDIYPVGLVQRYWAEDNEAFSLDRPLVIETPVTRSDGTVRWMLKNKRRVDVLDGAYLVVVATDITQQKETELALRESEERFRSLTQLSADWFWEQDEQFRFTSQTGGGLTRMNFVPEHSLGKARWELPYIGMQDGDWDAHRATLAAHQAFHNLELCLRTDSEDVHYISLSGEPVFGADGAFKGYRGVGREITARKRVEEALRKSEESHRLLAENSSDMISRLSIEGMVEYASPGSMVVLGRKPDRLIGLSLGELIHPDDLAYAREQLGDVAKRDQVNVVTCRARHENGRWVWVETSLRAVREPGSRWTSQVIGVSRNVDERVRVTQALSEFQYVLDNTLDMIFIFDSYTLRHTYVNRGAAEALGYPREELLRLPPWALLANTNEVQYRASIQPFVRGELQSRQFELLLRRADGGELPVDVTMQIVRWPGENSMFISVMRDATERKRVERMKNEFVSTVSHELRTPLTSIRGSLGLITGGAAGAVPEPAQNLVRIAYNNSERLVRLINDILDIEKIESGKMRFDAQPHSLRPLLEQSIEANRAYGEQLGVRFDVRGDIPEALALVDADRFMQVMSNLLSNAAKFSPSPGVVEISAVRARTGLRISVKDHGPGIPEAFRDKIFGKFNQADSSDSRQKGGTGLGLSIVKAIVEKLRGDIAFDTELGFGTTFHVTFPEVEPEAPALPAAATPELERPVLVCEDDADVANAIAAMLRQAGFQPDIARDLAQARALLAARRYFALTLDLLLPDGNGIDLIRELRGDPTLRNLPIVVVSMDSEQARARFDGEGSAKLDWLSKPVDRIKLLDLLRASASDAPDKRPRVLHVEDDADIKQVVSSIASDVAVFDFAATLKEALHKIEQQTYALIILDLELDDGSGWDLLAALDRLETPPPVVLFSAHGVDPERSQSVAAALTKSRTSNQRLREVISQFAGNGRDSTRS